MKIYGQEIILFIGILFLIFACSNRDDHLNNDENVSASRKQIVSFQIDDSTNYEYKLKKMDSVSIALQKQLCGSKWKLAYFTHRGNEYLVNKERELDSLIFTLSPDGNVFIDSVGLVGQWSLFLGAPNDTFVVRFLTFFSWKEDIVAKPFFIMQNYRFGFYREGATLSITSSGLGKKKLMVYHFTAIP